MVEKEPYLEDWDTWDLDVHVPCECGETVYLYQPDYVKACHQCGREYVARVKISVFLVGGVDHAVGIDTFDDNPEF